MHGHEARIFESTIPVLQHTAKLASVLLSLHDWVGQPLLNRPHMVSQAGGHGGRARDPLTVRAKQHSLPQLRAVALAAGGDDLVAEVVGLLVGHGGVL